MKSQLTKDQKISFYKDLPKNRRIYVTIRYDDRCGNGHNTFSITGDIYSSQTSRADRYHESGGCIHEEIEKYFPECRSLIKWHLCSSDGPLHYIANTLYHADDHGITDGWLYMRDDSNGIKSHCVKYGKINELQKIVDSNPDQYSIEPDQKTAKQANIDYARSSAIWPDATIDQLRDRKQLEDRLPALLSEFKHSVESIGFIF